MQHNKFYYSLGTHACPSKGQVGTTHTCLQLEGTCYKTTHTSFFYLPCVIGRYLVGSLIFLAPSAVSTITFIELIEFLDCTSCNSKKNIFRSAWSEPSVMQNSSMYEFDDLLAYHFNLVIISCFCTFLLFSQSYTFILHFCITSKIHKKRVF